MDQYTKSCVTICISEDFMQVDLYLSSSPDPIGLLHTEEYTFSNIINWLSEAGVKAGIDKKMISTICDEKLYDCFHVVAKGQSAHNGDDGFFTYHFRNKLDNKPKVLPDGSVDYKNIDIYESVKKGDLIAEYTAPGPARFGYNVKGGILSAIPGKGLNPIKGKGFTVNDDKTKYYADLNGKIEMKGNELIVSNLLEIREDIDYTSANIMFDGDVIVHGNVLTGASINTTGTISIMGNVEGATLIAGGDIELKAGMQGGSKGYINCKGDLWGKFFELSKLEVRGDIHANSLLNCEVVADRNIYVSGKHGIIVGGNISCQGNIEATVLGNMAGVRTCISAGTNTKAINELARLESILSELNSKYSKLEQVLEKLNSVKNPTELEKFESMKLQATTSLKSIIDERTTISTDIRQRKFILESCNKAYIKANKSLYPGVMISVNGFKYLNTSELYKVMLKVRNGDISLINMTDGDAI